MFLFENTACTDPEIATDMLLPTSSLGTSAIDKGVYYYMRELLEAECNKKESTYRAANLKHAIGSKKVLLHFQVKQHFYFIISINCSSVKTVTPSSLAFLSLLPAASPATT